MKLEQKVVGVGAVVQLIGQLIRDPQDWWFVSWFLLSIC